MELLPKELEMFVSKTSKLQTMYWLVLNSLRQNGMEMTQLKLMVLWLLVRLQILMPNLIRVVLVVSLLQDLKVS